MVSQAEENARARGARERGWPTRAQRKYFWTADEPAPAPRRERPLLLDQEEM